MGVSKFDLYGRVGFSLLDIEHVQKILKITPDVIEKRKLDRQHRAQKLTEKRKQMEEVHIYALH